MPAAASPAFDADLAALDAAVKAADAARIAAPGDAAGVTDQAAAAPGESPSPGVDPDAKRDAALVARIGVDWILDALQKQYPVLGYPEPIRERAASLSGAVMAKHDVLSWLKRWREEFELGMFLAGLAWESYKTIQKPKAAPAADAALAAQAAEPEAPHAAVVT